MSNIHLHGTIIRIVEYNDTQMNSNLPVVLLILMIYYMYLYYCIYMALFVSLSLILNT